MGKVALATLVAVLLVVCAPEPLARAWALVALPILGLALRRPAWRGAAVVATIAASSILQVDARLAARVPRALDGARLEFGARVAALPDAGIARTRFEVEVLDGPLAGRRLALAWYRPEAPRDAWPAAGERWRIEAQVRRPRAAFNPETTDLEAAWTARGIDGLGTVRAARREGGARPGLLALRARLLKAIDAACGARGDVCGVVAGLAIGHAAGIDDDSWRTFRRTGTVHLVAISGLHVTLLGLVAAALAHALARRIPALIRRVPAPSVAACVGFATAAGYAALAGASLPAQRTVLMLAVVTAAVVRGRAVSAGGVLGAALIAVLAWGPWAVLAPGLWLSFAGVAALVWGVHAQHGSAAWLGAQRAATLALAPLLLIAFGVMPWVAPFANLVAIPVFNLALVPTSLLGVVLQPFAPGAAAACFDLAARVVELTLPVLRALGECSPQLARGDAGPIALALAVVGAAWLLAPRGTPARALGFVLWLPLLFAPPRHAAGEFDVRVLDVGQGLAVVVTTADHALVYDTGPAGLDSDAAAWSLLPTLEALGRAPDRIVVSHSDRDHAGGIARLDRAYPAASWRMGAGLDGPPCRAGEGWAWDGVRFEFIHPDRPQAGNDGSCVLRVAGAGGAVLLPGDIEAAAEAELLLRGVPLRAEVVVAPHHGSASSSSAPWVAAVAARVVIHPAGWRNRWRFPRPEVVARYAAQGAVQYRTGEDGAIAVEFRAGRAPVVRRARETRRTWREP